MIAADDSCLIIGGTFDANAGWKVRLLDICHKKLPTVNGLAGARGSETAIAIGGQCLLAKETYQALQLGERGILPKAASGDLSWQSGNIVRRWSDPAKSARTFQSEFAGGGDAYRMYLSSLAEICEASVSHGIDGIGLKDILQPGLSSAVNYLEALSSYPDILSHLSNAAACSRLAEGGMGVSDEGSIIGLCSDLITHTSLKWERGNVSFGALDITASAIDVVRVLINIIQEAGGDIIRDVAIDEPILEKGTFLGVACSDGQAYRATKTLLCDDLKSSFMSVFDWCLFPKDFVNGASKLSQNGAVAYLDLLVDKPLKLAGNGDVQGESGERCFICDGVNEIDAARNAWSLKALAAKIPLSVQAWGPSFGGAKTRGRFGYLVKALYVPEHLSGKDWPDEAKAKLVETILKRLEEPYPGMREAIIDSRFVVPGEVSEVTGRFGGHINGQTLSAGQWLAARSLRQKWEKNPPVKGLHVHPGRDLLGRHMPLEESFVYPGRTR